MSRVSLLESANIGLVAAALALAVGCGGDKSDPGGRDTTGTAASTTGAGGSTSTTGTTGGAGAPGNCTPTAPPNEIISNFLVWDDGEWGEDMGLTGGTFSYTGDGTEEFAYAAVDEALSITGTINDYAGIGMWFGPCTDASAYDGISFTMGGTVGEDGQAVFQLQQSDNKEVEDAVRGDCDSAVNDCVNNEVAYDVPEEAATVQICFADMSGGDPNGEVDPSMLYALQYQFNCETDAACALDATIDDLKFSNEACE
jgi:hypothetical protein